MRCAVYIRVSTKDQNTSLVNQKDLFSNYLLDKGWDLYDIYVDVQSGTKSKRRNLQRLIEDAKSKKFDAILSKELSRLARNGEISYQIKNLAEKYNIHLITLDSAINTLNGDTEKFGMFAWIYEQESQRISYRMKSAFQTRAKKGVFKGSIAPYGYYVENNKLYIRGDNTPDVVKRIYREYLSGKGFDKIAKDLYEDGFPTPGQIAEKATYCSDKWHGSSIRLILENPHYTGDLVQGRSETKSVTSDMRGYKDREDYIIVENTHEAIISKQDFETVQQLIASRKKIRPQPNVHLFTNILFCNDCGHGMHYKKNRKGYICGNYNKHGQKACSDHIVRESELSKIVLSDIKSLISSLKDERIIASIENSFNNQRKRMEKELKSCKRELDILTGEKNKALRKFINEDISKEDYDFFIGDINTQLKGYQQKHTSLENALNKKFNSCVLSELYELKEKIIDIEELTPQILNRFVEKIEIKSDGTPKIFYRFSETSIYFSHLFINAQHSTCVVCVERIQPCSFIQI